MEAKDVIAAVRGEIQSGEINNALLDRCQGLTPAMANVLAAGVLAKALTYGYTIPSVIEEYVTAWKEAAHEQR